MNVRECIRLIVNKISTLDDWSHKNVNQIVDNRKIIDELNTQLRQYANYTKAIQDVYSFQLSTSTPFVEAPKLALRSEAYNFIFLLVNGQIFPIDMRGKVEAFNNFRYRPIAGITNWIMPWAAGKDQFLSVFPMAGTVPNTTQLTASISKTDTTIPVESTDGFMSNEGRLTIGSEKIVYKSKDSTNFYYCTRGSEMTDAIPHGIEAVLENNIFIYYSRLAKKIVVYDDNFIPPSILSREIEVCEEHMEGIVKIVAYNIMSKIDAERANFYKIDSDNLFQQYRIDIRKGYYNGRQGADIRDPYIMAESGIPFGTNLIY